MPHYGHRLLALDNLHQTSSISAQAPGARQNAVNYEFHLEKTVWDEALINATHHVAAQAVLANKPVFDK